MSAKAWVRVVYCEGWDPERRTIVGRLPVAVARERDRAGQQYAFCLVDPRTERVIRVTEIAWEAGFAQSWFLDVQDRREQAIEYRVLDGVLFRMHSRKWTYTDPEQAEFHDSAGFVEKWHAPDGTSQSTEHPNGLYGRSSERKYKAVAAELFRGPARFSDWAAITYLRSHVELVEEDPAEQEFAEPPWRPSTPLKAEGIESALQPGLRWDLGYSSGVTTVTEIVDAGTVRMPSGRLIAADPSFLDGGYQPFETTIAPGDYRVELTLLRFEDDRGNALVAAARLVVSAEPVVSWEPALQAGVDPRLLGDDDYYGFGVDGGMGCFTDADASAAFTDQVRGDVLDDVSGATTAVLTDPESGATLVAYSAGRGDGSYPTWIGRTASGEVGCFVSDMLLLRDAVLVEDAIASRQ